MKKNNASRFGQRALLHAFVAPSNINRMPIRTHYYSYVTYHYTKYWFFLCNFLRWRDFPLDFCLFMAESFVVSRFIAIVFLSV